jgi:D-tyrosyl-tRNA(Tyr) deacylase
MFAWDPDCWQWKQSVQDINGEVLCGKHRLLFASSPHAHISPVSQFTLLASTKRGTKPDFHGALGGDEAKKLYDVFFSKVQENYKAERVKDGVFQAMMVSFCCEGLILLLTASLGSSPCE